jgi:hypothetical protein
MKKKLALALCLAAIATPASAETKLPDKLLGYWCFTRAHWYPDEKIEPDITPLVRSNAFNCANLGGVRFWRRGNKSGFQLGRFDWRADCKISKIERVVSNDQTAYRLYSHCRAERSMFVSDTPGPVEEDRSFELWQANQDCVGENWKQRNLTSTRAR